MKPMTVLFSLALIALPAAAQSPDSRQVLSITEAQRAHVLEEMRGMLSGIQKMLGSLAKNDMAATAAHARSIGMSMARKAEDHLQGALPKAFMQLGMSVHQDFDKIAADAETMKDAKRTLTQLSDVMMKCESCHAAYQIRAKSDSAASSGGDPHAR